MAGAGAAVKVMFPDDLETFIKENREGSYTLLDVRQPSEYEQTHLPGSKLVPLPELAESTLGLDPHKPTIVYCAVGGRSRMAAQLLQHQGFEEIYHLQGGIEAWEAPTAMGPKEFHMKFIRGDETPVEIISLAYRMEEGLRNFHETAKSRTSDPELIAVLSRLIKAEESHEKALLELRSKLGHQGAEAEDLNAVSDAALIEGGIDMDEFMKENEPFLQTTAGYLDLAMMIETQALDLYLRMAAESKNESTRQVLLRIGDEEKAHLALLGRLLEGKIKASPIHGN